MKAIAALIIIALIIYHLPKMLGMDDDGLDDYDDYNNHFFS